MAKKKSNNESSEKATPLSLRPGKYIYACVSTPWQLASNNRSETDGNLSMLPKVHDGKKWRTIVNSDSLRLGLRMGTQHETDRRPLPVSLGGKTLSAMTNRRIDPVEKKSSHRDGDYEVTGSMLAGQETDVYYRDDILFGYMSAKFAKGEDKAGKCSKRKGAVNVSPAISLTPTLQETLNHFATPGAGAGDNGNKTNKVTAADGADPGKAHCVPHAEEVHYTSYNYWLGIDTTMLSFLDDESVKQEVGLVLRQVKDIPPVAGNQSRYAYDFSPESIVLRAHETDPSYKICNAFTARDGAESLSDTFVNRFNGDFGPDEIIIGTLSNAIFEQAKEIMVNGKPYFIEGKNLFKAITPAIEALMAKI